MDLTDKVAVVTGASSGIGEAAARALAAEGCTVVAVARRGERLEALAAQAPGIHPHVADVTDDAAVTDLVERVERDFGACHVLVNNAGVRSHTQFRGPDDVGDFIHVLDVNLVAVARCTAAFSRLLLASAPSRVINVGSVAGKIGLGSPAYSAAKFGVVGFSEALRVDWGQGDVAVCVVNPGYVHTEGFPQDRFLRIPVLRRLVVSPEVVAAAIVEVARSGQRERTVPRWYRTFVVLRHVVPPLVWAVGGRLLRR